MHDPPAKACLLCRYDLTRSDGPSCPECGRPFDPDNQNTYLPWPRPRRNREHAPALYALIGGMGGFSTGMLVSLGNDWSLLGSFAGGICLGFTGAAVGMLGGYLEVDRERVRTFDLDANASDDQQPPG